MDPSSSRVGRAADVGDDAVKAWHARDELLLIDVRRFTPGLVRPFLTAVIDHLVSMDAPDDVVVICGYQPSGLAFQLDLRPQTRGLFHYECEQRADGAWVETIRRL